VRQIRHAGQRRKMFGQKLSFAHLLPVVRVRVRTSTG
jgi:hypothetical protein